MGKGGDDDVGGKGVMGKGGDEDGEKGVMRMGGRR